MIDIFRCKWFMKTNHYFERNPKTTMGLHIYRHKQEGQNKNHGYVYILNVTIIVNFKSVFNTLTDSPVLL